MSKRQTRQVSRRQVLKQGTALAATGAVAHLHPALVQVQFARLPPAGLECGSPDVVHTLFAARCWARRADCSVRACSRKRP